MKGPGLPGFRKQVGRGFYKTPPMDVTTSNRSPVKMHEGKEHDDIEEVTQREKKISKARENLIDAQNKGLDINWEQDVTKVNMSENDNKTIIEKKTSTWGTVNEGGGTGIPLDDAWKNMSDSEKGKYPGGIDEFKIEAEAYWQKDVFKDSQDINIIEPVKDIEYTNYKIGYKVNAPGGTAKIDNNDFSARFNMHGVDGTQMQGQLSRDDIEQRVKSGQFKYETVMKDGKEVGTGNLLMSKDYYEGEYTTQVNNYELGENNYNAWIDGRDEWMTQSKKDINKTLQEEFPNTLLSKGGDSMFNKKYENRKKELTAERRAFGVENNYLTKSGGSTGNIPDFMRGNPNFGRAGGATVGIYNDDEVVFGTQMPSSYLQNRDHGPKYRADGSIMGNSEDLSPGHALGSKNINQQGSRPNDWELNDKGVLVVKEGAQTYPEDEWFELDRDERGEVLDSDMINGAGVKIRPSDGYRDTNGNWVSGVGFNRRETKQDHLLTNQRQLVKTDKGLKYELDDPNELSPMGSEFKHNLSYDDDDQKQLGDKTNNPDLKVTTNETDAVYSKEDQAVIDKYNMNL